jgi:hypothetical protein
MEVTLKEASLLCRKSEKTLRRKIECGLLGGRREPLEFGGFMWLIDVNSLEELYPGSRPSQLPQLWEAPELPQVRLKNRIDEESSAERQLTPQRDLIRESAERRSDISDDDDDEDGEEEWNVRQGFLDYILEENRGLKIELKERDARILNLNERAFVLERALGEQEGKATTQTRVLEWFQSQESEREKQRAETERKMLVAGAQPVVPAKSGPRSYLAAFIGAGVTLLVFLFMLATGLLHIQL